MLRAGFLSLLLILYCAVATDAAGGDSGSNQAHATEADEPRGFGALDTHPHDPIVVQSRPVVERIPVAVIEPADICIASDGSIVVADAKANRIFRILRNGNTELAAANLPDMVRLCLNASGELFVLTAGSSDGSIYQVTTTGYTALIHRIPFAPVAFGCDSVGNFLVVAKENRRIGLFDSAGDYQEFGRLAESAVDVALNSADQFQVLLRSGQVLYVNAQDRRATVGFASEAARRLYQLPDGKLATLNAASQNRQAIQEVAFGPETPGPVFALVPTGTNAIAFDKLGNLCLCNPDLRAVTKVTTTFLIPCPHCAQTVRMIFSAQAVSGEAADELSSRSY